MEESRGSGHWHWRPLVFRIVPLITLVEPQVSSRIFNAFVIWFRAIRHPIRTIEATLHIAEASKQNRRIWSVTRSTIYLTCLTNVPVFWYLNVTAKGLTFQTSTYCVLIAAILVGGFTFHGVLRLSNRPSNLRATLAVYSIPQLIFMPIISVLSIPALYYHYQALEGLKEVFQSLHTIHSLIMRLAIVFFALYADARPTVQLFGLLIGLVTLGMQVMVLEILWQVYQTSRPKTYFAGVLALTISALVVGISTAPIRDLIFYLASQ